MTEKLISLLDEQAYAVDFGPVDLEAVRRDGQRRVRRRRGVIIVVASGVAAAVVVGVLAVTGGGKRDDVVVVDALPTNVVTWATGSTLHTATDEVDLGHPIKAYVRTEHGYVFTDGNGAVFSFVAGEVAEVGSISDAVPLHLVADGDGSLVGWVDTSGDRPAIVILDLESGDIRTFDEENPEYLFAIDGRTAFWRDARGVVAVDVDSGDVEVVEAEPATGFNLLAVEEGLMAVADEDGLVQVVGGRDTLRIPGVHASAAVFSPDARFLSIAGDEPQVVKIDHPLGEPVDFAVSGIETGYDWLDARTVAVIGESVIVDNYGLLSCPVPRGRCDIVASDLATAADLESGTVVVPVGKGVG